ncbi:hypothetical protein AAC387_Pa10g2028 [Persea americana]
MLTQAVLCSIPHYSLGLQAIPKAQLSSISSAQAKFLWHGSNSPGGWTPVSWKIVTQPTFPGGLGIKDSTTQHATALAHLVWRFLSQPTTWWSRLLRQKYLHNVEFKNCGAKAVGL